MKGFAESYSMCEVVAKKWNGWGFVYAFTELALGIAFLTGFNPLLTNIVTLLVMTAALLAFSKLCSTSIKYNVPV